MKTLQIALKHCAEWLYYGFWYWVAWYTLELPRWMIHDGTWIRQPFLWIVSQGWVFAYLPTLAERLDAARHNSKQQDGK